MDLTYNSYYTKKDMAKELLDVNDEIKKQNQIINIARSKIKVLTIELNKYLLEVQSN